LEPIRDRGGLVLEIGCGSGALTRHLVTAGHRVLATDASPAMLALARAAVPEAMVETLVLPDDAVPPVDAVVGIGHALNYLPDVAAIRRGLRVLAQALRPGGVFALDLCDVEWARLREGAAPHARVAEDWAIITRFSQPSPGRFDRDITTFVRTDDNTYRRREEHHDNVMVNTSTVPDLLRGNGVTAHVGTTFDDPDNPLPRGLRTVVGHKPA
jgi:SAM-dependent methyltransferase